MCNILIARKGKKCTNYNAYSILDMYALCGNTSRIYKKMVLKKKKSNLIPKVGCKKMSNMLL